MPRKLKSAQPLEEIPDSPAESANDVITIDIQPLMIPVAIVIAGALMAIAIFFGLRSQTTSLVSANNGGSTVTTGSTTTAEDTPALDADGTQVDKLVSLAESIKIDGSDFRVCLEAERFASEIKADTADANAIGITGTPGFVVGRKQSDDTVTGVMISGAYPYTTFSAALDYYLGGNTEAPTSLPELPAVKVATTSMDDDPVLGNSNSDVVIVEFSDYECPYCQRHFNQTLPDIKSNYLDTNKAALVYRDLPLPFHDPNASLAANAGECIQELAGDAKYYEFHDTYFKNTKSNGTGL